MGFKLPTAKKWDKHDKEKKKKLFDDLAKLLPDGTMTKTGALVTGALAEVCNPLQTPDTERGTFWRPYRDGVKKLHHFFAKWLEYNPGPANPGLYIEYWDYLANTHSGLELTNADRKFKKWFVRFLNLRGVWLSSTSSTTTLAQWGAYKGTAEHPFNINDYIIPKGGFKSFNQFFLRNVKPTLRPLCAHKSET
ncbi:MAG: hypothetical protein QNK37_08220, partial [Acidobacteriota bacterium]|nr:hypothetical protein [Acidobacteriota bacterium]